jgi:hypothetical protein
MYTITYKKVSSTQATCFGIMYGMRLSSPCPDRMLDPTTLLSKRYRWLLHKDI